MSEFNITSSDATAVLTVKDLFPAGIALEMFTLAAGSNDGAVTTTRTGIDGRMVAAFQPTTSSVTITLEPVSSSYSNLCTLWTAMRTNRTIYSCTLVCTVPSIRRIFTWSNGVLKSGAPFPGIDTQLKVTSWGFEFESMHPAKY